MAHLSLPRYDFRGGGFPLHGHRYAKPFFELHGHHYLELMVVVKDGGTHRIDGKARPMRRGEVFFLGPWNDHEGRHGSGGILDHYVFDFLPPALGVLDGAEESLLLAPFFRRIEKEPLRLSEDEFARVEVQCERLLCEIRDPKPFGEAVQSRLLGALLFDLLRFQPVARRAEADLTVKALRHIHETFRQGFTPATLSAACGRSYSRILQTLRVTMGRSPRELLVERRLGEARRLLLETGLPLGQVTGLCGFSDPSYFARAFRASYGQSPSDWRRTRRPEGPRGAEITAPEGPEASREKGGKTAIRS